MYCSLRGPRLMYWSLRGPRLMLCCVFSGAKVPQSVLDKAQKCKEEGGAESINNLMSELPELLNRNREILNVVGIP